MKAQPQRGVEEFSHAPKSLVGGFTLIELLVAVSIVGILAGISVASYINVSGRSRWDVARSVLSDIVKGEHLYCSKTLSDGGSEGAGFYNKLLSKASSGSEWRNLGLVNPWTTGSPVWFEVPVPAGVDCSNQTFTATAYYDSTGDGVSDKSMSMDQDGDLSTAGGWTRP